MEYIRQTVGELNCNSYAELTKKASARPCGIETCYKLSYFIVCRTIITNVVHNWEKTTWETPLNRTEDKNGGERSHRLKHFGPRGRTHSSVYFVSWKISACRLVARNLKCHYGFRYTWDVRDPSQSQSPFHMWAEKQAHFLSFRK